MRFYLVPPKGTGGKIEEPLPPSQWYGPNDDVAEQVTIRFRSDAVGPAIDSDAEVRAWPVMFHGTLIGFLVADFKIDRARDVPRNAIDLGNARSPSQMGHTLQPAQVTKLATMLGIEPKVLEGMTVKQLVRFIIPDGSELECKLKGHARLRFVMD